MFGSIWFINLYFIIIKRKTLPRGSSICNLTTMHSSNVYSPLYCHVALLYHPIQQQFPHLFLPNCITFPQSSIQSVTLKNSPSKFSSSQFSFSSLQIPDFHLTPNFPLPLHSKIAHQIFPNKWILN